MDEQRRNLHEHEGRSTGDEPLERLLRTVATAFRPDPAARRRHISAAIGIARRAGEGRGRIRYRLLPGRLAWAGGLAAMLLLAGTALLPGASQDQDRTTGDAPFVPEIAMAEGFLPSAVTLDRTEEHVILTVAAEQAAAVGEELTALLGADVTLLSERDDRSTFTVPASVAAQLSQAAAVEATPDTPVRSLALPQTQQDVPSWGLDRLDGEGDAPLDGRYSYVSSGDGVRIYIVDTGVRSDHADLGGRVAEGFDALGEDAAGADCSGHGTHVAGTAAGASYGVAKEATIVPVRVLNCDGEGYASSIIAGLNWIVANHPGGPGVVNLSVGGPANAAVDQAVADATARGLVVVAAAGNEGGDACTLSPARAAAAVTTGATTSEDVRASFSNAGSCVDLFAPGVGITSAWPSSQTAAAALSGTSMAAPHVAGLAARLLQQTPGASPSEIAGGLLGTALPGAVDDTAGAANLLANLVEDDDCDQLLDAIEDGELSLDELEDGLPEACEDEARRRGLLELLPEDRQLPPGIDRSPGLERAPGLDGQLPPGLELAPGLRGEAPGQPEQAPGRPQERPGRQDEAPGPPAQPPGQGRGPDTDPGTDSEPDPEPDAGPGREPEPEPDLDPDPERVREENSAEREPQARAGNGGGGRRAPPRP